MGNLNYSRSVPVRHEVDVCVIGGGPAGVAAALAAARQGSKVFLVEAQGFFGGAGTAALIPAFMPFDNGVDFLAGGIGKEIYEKCIENNAVVAGRSVGIQVEVLKRIYDELVEGAGISYSFHTNLIDVIVTDGHVEAVILAAKSGIYAVKAQVYIDATGDGDLCVWSGAPYKKGDENGAMMPGTLCSIWADIDWDHVKRPDSRELERAFQDGVFTQEDRHLPGMWRVSNTLGGGNIGHTFGVDGTDERSLTQALVTGRKIVPEYERYYTQYLGGGYEKAQLVITGSYLGIRETRRIMGEYVMTVDDFNNRASFDDEIGRFSYPVDIHIAAPTKAAYDAFHKEFTSMRYKNGESYGIPYRSLIPLKVDNVLVGGRCISTDRQMQSSIRVMPCCYITGQACGAAAALAVQHGQDIRGINVHELQQTLKGMGGYLPNCE